MCCIRLFEGSVSTRIRYVAADGVDIGIVVRSLDKSLFSLKLPFLIDNLITDIGIDYPGVFQCIHLFFSFRQKKFCMDCLFDRHRCRSGRKRFHLYRSVQRCVEYGRRRVIGVEVDILRGGIDLFKDTEGDDFFSAAVQTHPFQGRLFLIALLVIDHVSGYIKKVQPILGQHFHGLRGKGIAAQTVIGRNIHIIDVIALRNGIVYIAVKYRGDGVGFRIQAVQIVIASRTAEINTPALYPCGIDNIIRNLHIVCFIGFDTVQRGAGFGIVRQMSGNFPTRR